MELVDLEDFIEKNYSLDSLRKLYKNFLSQIINYEGDIKLDTKELNFSIQKLQKKELSKLLAKTFFDKKIFNDLLNLLPEETLKVFRFLIWEKTKLKVNEVEKILKLEDKILSNATKNKPVELNTNYSFFLIEKVNNTNLLSYEYKIYIPDEIKNYIKDYFPPPDEIKLEPLEAIEDTDFKNINLIDNTIKSIYLYFTYINSNKIDLSKEKPSKAVLRNIKEFCEIEEFFKSEENKDLEYLKTEILHNYLKDIDIKESNYNEIIKTIFNYFLSDNYSLDLLLFHLKGKNILKEDEYFIDKSKQLKKIFLDSFSKLPHNQWIDFNNFYKSIYYKDIPFLISKKIFETNVIYFDELKKSNNYSYTQKNTLNEDNYNDIFFIPLLKGLVFLFSSIGLLDIAYNYPKNSFYIQKNQDYLSVFDELKYLKLNDIGASLLGIIPEIDYKIDSNIKVELDNEYLLIKVNKEDKIKCAFIETLANKVSQNTYLVTESSFLSNCKSLEDINNKIKNFYSEISDNPGEIWEEFFNKLKSKIINISRIDDIEIFQLPHDKVLLKKLSEINDIYNLFYKVEDFKIAIKKNNINAFIQKLFESELYINL
ncbi:MAG: hypothetical protein KatS3mg068_2232 [Candidatus Sericytochromatia bacterium]|nr:MAG: hypothetical protein KatS3mg068_2232 [Candidatus Sericytochromatia bacterium]